MTEQRERFIEWADKEFGRLPTLSMQICQTERFASYYKCFKAAEAPLLERIAELETKLSVAQSLYEESCDKSYDFGAMQCRIAELERQLVERKFAVELPELVEPTNDESCCANSFNDAVRACKTQILAAGGEVR